MQPANGNQTAFRPTFSSWPSATFRRQVAFHLLVNASDDSQLVSGYTSKLQESKSMPTLRTYIAGIAKASRIATRARDLHRYTIRALARPDQYEIVTRLAATMPNRG